MKITRRQIRGLIKEAWQAEREHYYSTDKPRGGSTFAVDFINPDRGSIKEYLSLAVQLGLQVTTNTSRMLTVQGSKDALIEFGAVLEEMEGGPNIRGGAGFDEQGLINSMRPITETTRRQLGRIIKEVLGAYGSVDGPEYEAGYEAGYKGWEASDNNNEYLEGYEAGKADSGGKDDLEYNRGYEDGLDGYPPSSNADTSYDAGYEDGLKDATLSEAPRMSGIMEPEPQEVMDDIERRKNMGLEEEVEETYAQEISELSFIIHYERPASQEEAFMSLDEVPNIYLPEYITQDEKDTMWRIAQEQAEEL